MGHGGHGADVERLSDARSMASRARRGAARQLHGGQDRNAVSVGVAGQANAAEFREDELHERQGGGVHLRVVIGEIDDADVDLVSTLLDAQVTAVRVVL